MRIYTKPIILVDDIRVEAGFAVSTDWAVGAPGGEIDFNDYGTDL